MLAAAADGSLATSAGLSAQTERLLATPRAAEAFEHFVNEWWELDSLPAVEKDTDLFRTWSDGMPAAFAEETRRFLDDAWQNGPTLERLFTGATTYADINLADFYGYPLPSQPGFQPIAVDPAHAAGLFSQGAFLATHAKANQTSPVLRGKFVRARLFCDPPGPPPPNLVITPPVVDPRKSTRERFQEHTADAFCASCHQLMDPIGFAFEHFDATGRWRDIDGGKPVDANGMLTETDVDGAIDGVQQLTAEAAEERAGEELRRHAVVPLGVRAHRADARRRVHDRPAGARAGRGGRRPAQPGARDGEVAHLPARADGGFAMSRHSERRQRWVLAARDPARRLRYRDRAALAGVAGVAPGARRRRRRSRRASW